MKVLGLKESAIAEDGRQLKFTLETDLGLLELESSDILIEALIGQLSSAVRTAGEKRYGLQSMNSRLAEFVMSPLPPSGTVMLTLKTRYEPALCYLLPDEKARALGDQLVRATSAQPPSEAGAALR